MKSSDVPIPEPCGEDWAGMTGDERRRFCARCDQHVHDLSAMTETEARAVVATPEVCVRYTVDPDDHIRFRSRRRFLARALLAAGAAVSLPAAASVQHTSGEPGLVRWALDALEAWWSEGDGVMVEMVGQPVVAMGTSAVEPPPADPEPPATEAPVETEPERPVQVLGRLPVRPRKLQGKPARPIHTED